MSQETKQAAKDTERDLRRAEEHLSAAEQSAKQTGDKSLHQKVTKIKEAVTETRKDLDSKLNGG